MSSNRLIIASAGSGKTTKIVDEALSITDERVLITTYTQANEGEIKKKIIEKNKSIPSNITVQPWFSFLIKHGVKPYQGVLNDIMFHKDVKGLNLVSQLSGRKTNSNGEPITYKGRPLFWGEDHFSKYYFDSNWKIYSDKLSKFTFKVNQKTNNEIFDRISRIYPYIFVDEVQDLAGYDLEVLKLLFKTDAKVLLVGDPRQVTYLTHYGRKNPGYRDGKIKQYILDKCDSLIEGGVDEESLKYSHRNNEMICKYSSQLYPDFPQTMPCKCCLREDTGHDGVFLIRPKEVDRYLNMYNPTQLRWNSTVKTNSKYPVMNFGESKGLTLDRVLIYPTTTMNPWIEDNDESLSGETRAKLYVGITRAKYSTAIIYDYDPDKEYDNAKKFQLD